MSKIIVGFLALLVVVPGIANAQLGNVTNLVISIRNIVDILIPLAFAVALLFFFWGLAKFILASGSEEAKEEGKNIMIWGLVALFIMAAVWGIVQFIGTALGIDTEQDLDNVPGVLDNG